MLVFLPDTKAQISGSVFRDYDQNGLRSDTLPVEVGVAGVLVKAFVDNRKTPISITTGADGTFLFNAVSVPAGLLVRLEISNFPVGDFNAPSSKGGGTSVQFLTAPATRVNIGVNYPNDYCQRTGVTLAVPCYVNGNTQLTTDANGNPVPADKQAGLSTALVGVPYPANGIASPTNFPPDHYATAGQIGSVWGVAYQRLSKKLFTSTVVKRHMGFGPLGPGGIYVTDVPTKTTSNFVNVADLGIDVGNDPHADPLSDLFGDKTQASTDPSSMTAMGRVSFGGMDMSDDDQTLYFMNLKDRKLYGLFLGSPARVPTAADVKSWAIPNPGCSNGDYRPWAVKVYRGRVYVSVVCSAETSQMQSDLKATIYRIDPTAAAPVFDEVLAFPLNFRRGPADLTGDPAYPEYSCARYDHWLPWTDAWPTPCGNGPSNSTFVMYPQPIVTDLAFDDDGSMIIGFLDRFGHLAGVANRNPQGNGAYDGFTGGDLLRAYYNNGTFELEKNGKAGPLTGSGVGNSEGPVDAAGQGGEFYGLDNWMFYGHVAHAEVTNGALTVIPGNKEVVTSAFDPIEQIYKSAGLKVFNNRNGALNRNYVLYTVTPGAFGKASGLGGTKALCDLPGVEIGNRLWFDDNRDGIQDAYEPGIDGITITLHDMAAGGRLVASQVTKQGGQFYFNDSTADTPIKFNHTYEIRVDTIQFPLLDISLAGVKPVGAASGGRLAARNGRQAAATGPRKYFLSPAFRSDNADGYLRDSNAGLVGATGVISVTTGFAGQHDFTYDLSIYTCPELANEKYTLQLCSGAGVDSIVAITNHLSRVDSVRFVLFSSPQSGTAMYGASGVVLATMKPTAADRTVLRNAPINTTNNGPQSASQYVYAIVYPTPDNFSCRQSGVTQLLISPALSASATGGKLTCSTPSVSLSGSAVYGDGSPASNATYNWTGPNSFTSSLANEAVSKPGVYTLAVGNPSCTNAVAIVTAIVVADTVKPVMSTTLVAKACASCSASMSASAPGSTFDWTGPNGFMAAGAGAAVKAAGIYVVKATGNNGCFVSARLAVKDFDCPALSATATGGMLTCRNSAVTLTSSVQDTNGGAVSGVNYVWTGPGSFTSAQANPSVSQPGAYTLNVSQPSCPLAFTSATVSVVADTEKPVMSTTLTAKACASCSAVLSATAVGATLAWSGPAGFTASVSSVTVSPAGTYTVAATASNGCFVSTSLIVRDFNCPEPKCLTLRLKRLK